MTARHLQLAVIAPKTISGALTVLIQSAPNLELLAAASSWKALVTAVGEGTPDAVLLYLVQENHQGADAGVYHPIGEVKARWPEATRIAIVKYTSQQENAIQAGAHIALVEGVSADRLLAAFEGISI